MKYAYSIKTSRVKEKDFPYEGQSVTCITELVAFAKSLFDADIEKMLTVYLDAQNKVICVQVMNGTVNQAVVYPREILRHALLSGASALVLIHNHPSGYKQPSDCDRRLTDTLKDCCKLFAISLHDHLILAGQSFYSFREEGII